MNRWPWTPALSPNAWLRWEAVAPRLPEAAKDVLEVGCGRGGFAVRLAERYRYVGVEPDSVSAGVARRRMICAGLSGEIREGNVGVVPADERFDLVCAFEVIEHIEDDRAAVAAWVRHVRSGGLLMVTAPARQSRFGAPDEMVGHFRRYDVDVIAELLAGSGLEDVRAAEFGAPFGYVLEAVRTVIARTRARSTETLSLTERTAASGRLLQPGDGYMSSFIWLGMLPFGKLQRAFPGRGPAVVATGRRPSAELGA